MNYFKNNFLIVFLLLFLHSSNLNAEVVKKIEVFGNKRISKETIMVFGNIKKGKNYEAEDVNDLINNLYSTDFFSKIEVSLEEKILKIFVKERPVIDSVIFKGIKAEKFRKLILENIQLRQKTSFSKVKVKNDVNVIKAIFRNNGYYFVEVDTEAQTLEGNRVKLIFTIDIGKKAKIKKIFFLGDKKIRDKKLRSIITSEESRFWKFLSATKYLNEQRIDLDKRLLTSYYKNKGYYEVQVASKNVEYSEGEGFILTYVINAGKRYRFKKAFINVSSDIEKQPFFVLNEDLKKLVGDYYSPKKLDKILKRIDRLSEEKELQFINHRLDETLENDYVTVKIDIFEGKKFFVERINVVGNNVTNETVIRSEMIIDEGDPYSALLLNRSINRIKARGLFAKVEEKILPGSSDDTRLIEIEVEEQATGEIVAGAGVGTSGGSIGFSVIENNFMGKGIKLDTSLDLTEETIRGKFSVNNPNFNYSGNTLNTIIESSKTDKLSTAGYESTKTGFTLGTSFEQYEDFYVSPSISSYYEDVSTLSTASDTLKQQAGTFASTNFSYSLILDKRDQRFQTTEGFRSSFTQRIPLYSDTPSLINGFDYSYYHPLLEDMTGTFKFFSRAINSINDKDVRISERLHIPSSMMRGFERGKVGPKDSTEHVGGNYAAAASFAVSLPNLLPEDLNTDVSVFLDTGNVWGVDYSDTVGESNTIRSALGVSTNIFTPIGPLSFSLSQNLSKGKTDKTESFRFSLGTTF